jgi:hypothetical protein
MMARLHVDRLAGEHGLAHRHRVGGQDVALLAVGVRDQRDARRAVGIVLYRDDLAGHAVLVAAEVDEPESSLVATAAVAHGHPAQVVPAVRAPPRSQ